MPIQSINNFRRQQSSVNKQEKKAKFTDKFETKLKNSADLNDCIAVPRTIFKGYLGVMFGTALASIAGLLNKSKLKTGINLLAIGLSTYGTWSFARPYVIKGAVPNTKPNTKN